MGWMLYPSGRVYFAGYGLGLFFSLLNGLITMQKTIKTGEYAQGLIKRRPGIGTLQRFLLAGFAGYVAMKFPGLFHWAAVIVGLTTVTMISLVIALVYHYRQKKSVERGER
ncbi:ATP synthase subunit I [Paenibacillus humicola]|uniref:ATP synthase subunit I n=1 Tax=Paenibacillus humicola TaxID=3110540 RepID=UPI00237BB7A0|nr:ATP synthase subunit I [Paenibacillus humicola]